MDYQLAATKNFCTNVGPRNKKRFLISSYRWHANHRRKWSGHHWRVVINTLKTSTRSALVLFLMLRTRCAIKHPWKKQAYNNKLTTKKQMQMQTWWALVGARIKLRSKVIFFNFVSFSRLINFVRQCRKTTKNVGSGTPTITPIKQTEKKFGSCWFSIFDNFLNIFWNNFRIPHAP